HRARKKRGTPTNKIIVFGTKVYSTRCSTEQIYPAPRLIVVPCLRKRSKGRNGHESLDGLSTRPQNPAPRPSGCRHHRAHTGTLHRRQHSHLQRGGCHLASA